MVGEAQRTRAPIQRLADVIAAYFVQVVVAIAVVTAIVWWFLGPEPRFAYAFLNAIAVLIIACPCAVGLATPISMTVAMGLGARSGILFRNAEAIERMRDIDTVVVDKTGTLTLGHPALTDFVVEGIPEGDALALVAGVEQLSEHPIALAIVEGAKARGGAPGAATAFEAVNGLGVQARGRRQAGARGEPRLPRAAQGGHGALGEAGGRLAGGREDGGVLRHRRRGCRHGGCRRSDQGRHAGSDRDAQGHGRSHRHAHRRLPRHGRGRREAARHRRGACRSAARRTRRRT